jgi:hypothetical protein
VDDERPANPLAYAKTPALWIGGIIGSLVVLATVILVAWDLFVAPVWDMPPLTFGEALGAALFVSLYAGIGYLLKEERE